MSATKREMVRRSPRPWCSLERRGFGGFKVRQHRSRTARNPKVGTAVYVPAKKVPRFKTSKRLRNLLNTPVHPVSVPYYHWCRDHLRQPGQLHPCHQGTSARLVMGDSHSSGVPGGLRRVPQRGGRQTSTKTPWWPQRDSNPVFTVRYALLSGRLSHCPMYCAARSSARPAPPRQTKSQEASTKQCKGGRLGN